MILLQLFGHKADFVKHFRPDLLRMIERRREYTLQVEPRRSSLIFQAYLRAGYKILDSIILLSNYPSALIASYCDFKEGNRSRIEPVTLDQRYYHRAILG